MGRPHTTELFPHLTFKHNKATPWGGGLEGISEDRELPGARRRARSQRGAPPPAGPVALTPAQAQEALADEAVPEAARHGHVGLPGLGEHPAEGRQEEEVQEGGHQRAHHLRGQERRRGARSLDPACPPDPACPGEGPSPASPQ